MDSAGAAGVRHPHPPMRADARRNRERLIAAALATFTERGADDTSLEEIARRAGVGIGTLYRHFPTRQALLEAVYRDQVDALCGRAEVTGSGPSSAAELTGWLQALIEFSLTKHLLTAELLAGGVDSPLVSTCRTDLLAAFTRVLTRAQQAGLARPGIEPRDLLRLTHAITLAAQRADDPAAEASRLLHVMLGGVLEPQPR
jgi:AcrR family transcriptional regulator